MASSREIRCAVVQARHTQTMSGLLVMEFVVIGLIVGVSNSAQARIITFFALLFGLFIPVVGVLIVVVLGGDELCDGLRGVRAHRRDRHRRLRCDDGHRSASGRLDGRARRVALIDPAGPPAPPWTRIPQMGRTRRLVDGVIRQSAVVSTLAPVTTSSASPCWTTSTP